MIRTARALLRASSNLEALMASVASLSKDMISLLICHHIILGSSDRGFHFLYTLRTCECCYRFLTFEPVIETPRYG
jgi:hypothetical protein